MPLAPGMKIIRPIVPIREWLNDPYYLGPEAKALYPFWKERLIEFFEGDYNTMINYGSYSLGKTYVARIMVARVIYEMSCIQGFPLMFDLSPNTVVQFVFLSMTMGKARSTLVKPFLRLVDSIPYFQKVCKRRMDTDSIADFGFAQVTAGSKAEHLTGEDVYGVIFDESNFVKAKAGEEFESAKRMFLEARIRSHTRYATSQGQFGFFALLSSAGYSTSFAEDQIKRADKHTKVVIASSYDVKPEKAYSGVRFDVFAGEGDIPAFIVEDVAPPILDLIAKNTGMNLKQYLAQYPERVAHPPVELKKYYQEDIDFSLRSLSGIPGSKTSLLLKNRKLLVDSTVQTLRNPIMNGQDTINLTLFSDEDIEDLVDFRVVLSNIEDGAKLFIHIDQSIKGDKTGFGVSYKATSGKIRIPLQLSIYKTGEKGDDNEIDISKVEDIVYRLRDYGCSVQLVSYDQYASKYASQNLKKRLGKDKVEYLSVDIDDQPYLMFNYLMKKKAIETYFYKPFHDNYIHLIHDVASAKVDHDEAHAKDVTDAVVGSVFNCYRSEGLTPEELAFNAMTMPDPNNPIEMAMAVAFGISAGYEKSDTPKPIRDRREVSTVVEEQDWYSSLLADLASDE